MEKKKIAQALELAIKHAKKEFIIDEAISTVVFGGDDISTTITEAGKPPVEPEPVPDSEVTRPTFTVVREGAEALIQLLAECDTDEELRLVGHKRTKAEIGDFLRSRVFSDQTSSVTEDDVKGILKALRNQILEYESTMAIPLLQLVGGEISIGNVTFRPPTEVLAAFEKGLIEIIEQGPHPEQEKPAAKQMALQTLHGLLNKGGCLATVKERGTPDTLVDIATTAIVRCCALLQVYLTWYFPDPDNRREVFPNPVAYYAGALLYIEGNFNLSAKRRGTNFPIKLGEQEIEFLTSKGLFEVAKLFDPGLASDPTAAAVVTASWWISRATLSSIHSEGLAFYIVATERLLFQKESVTVEKWTSRMLWLLGPDAASRRNLIPQLDRAYKVRSKIVHQGVTAVEDLELTDAKNLSMNCYFEFIDRLLKGKSQAEIISSLDDAARGL